MPGLWRDETAAAAAEYALILAIVGSGIATAAASLGGSVSGALDRAGAVIASLSFGPAATTPAASGGGNSGNGAGAGNGNDGSANNGNGNSGNGNSGNGNGNSGNGNNGNGKGKG